MVTKLKRASVSAAKKEAERLFHQTAGVSAYRHQKARVAIFCGPSISKAEVLKILPKAQVLAPIKRGMLAEAVEQGFNVIGIIDGTYINQTTLGGHELLRALNSGTAILGAASLGALRAVEFERHGMVGVGTIYGWYKAGVTYRDDEVVVPMHPQTHAALTEPLINLRYATIRGLNEELIGEQTAAALLSIYEKFFYQDRRYSQLFEKALADKSLAYLHDEVAAFRTFLNSNTRDLDLKRKDSERLLLHIKDSFFTG